MERLPLFFTFQDRIFGNGFLAEIEACGRAVVECNPDEEGMVWINGVHPGGIAAGAATHPAAYGKFREAYREVLFDIAEEEATFANFKKAVLQFFSEVCRPTDAEWWAAVEQVRAEGHREEGLAIKSADTTEATITIQKVKSTPEYNVTPVEEQQLVVLDMAA